MRVVFLEDVAGVAQGGDVKEVKNGFARNYLIPKSLAVPANHNALQGVRRLAKEAEEVRLRTLNDMKDLAGALNETQVNVEMRAGASGRLYGSVTNAIIADELGTITDREIDRRTVMLAEPIRELGVFDVKLRLHPEVDADIKVVVYATGTDPNAVVEADGEDAEAAETAEDSVAQTDEEILAELEREQAAETTVPEDSPA